MWAEALDDDRTINLRQHVLSISRGQGASSVQGSLGNWMDQAAASLLA